MSHREVFLGTLSETAVALETSATAQAQTATNSKKDDVHHDRHFDTCAKACAECQLECHACHHHCEALVATGKQDHVKTMKLCADCGDICGVAANIVSQHGSLSSTVCEVCASACDECGRACAEFADDKHMQKCADECLKSAAACREMIKHTGSGHLLRPHNDHESSAPTLSERMRCPQWIRPILPDRNSISVGERKGAPRLKGAI